MFYPCPYVVRCVVGRSSICVIYDMGYYEMELNELWSVNFFIFWMFLECGSAWNIHSVRCFFIITISRMDTIINVIKTFIKTNIILYRNFKGVDIHLNRIVCVINKKKLTEVKECHAEFVLQVEILGDLSLVLIVLLVFWSDQCSLQLTWNLIRNSWRRENTTCPENRRENLEEIQHRTSVKSGKLFLLL